MQDPVHTVEAGVPDSLRAAVGSNLQRVAQIIGAMKADLARPLRIENLAARARRSIRRDGCRRLERTAARTHAQMIDHEAQKLIGLVDEDAEHRFFRAGEVASSQLE
jgi:transcriptional regulator GlxA family with amidase domain